MKGYPNDHYKNNDPLAKLAKKRRRITFLKTSLFSLLACLLALIISFKGLSSLTAKNGQKIYENYQQLAQIAYPNISYDSLYYFPSGQFTGKIHADRFKDLDGIPIPYSPYEAYYNLTGTYDSAPGDAFSSKAALYDRGTRQKIPQFYNTQVQFTKNEAKTSPSQDLKQVSKMNNQIIEVAITFDKPYTYQEIKKKIPKTIKQNWFWIGTYTKLDTSQWSTSYQFGTDPDNLKSPHLFLQNMKKVYRNGSRVSIGRVDIYSDLKKYLKKSKKIKNSDQLTFSGMILTGKSEHFEALNGQEWIYASSIGATIENQGYYKLDSN
ncbi:sigma factor regulator N-terminal domain-containing protein [Streptococcus pseudoporcinus]|uniref:sigma factor regulator N-terminal domain-containing protein n=1 Tax=Streptococcus pseudoporcinus TaxID=361101 RepID=UPI0015F2B587|nr:sigma factor regulator N-terminal domain-containing protein [Streptococcus pseudoporcinus]